jgi:hypothetical protein
VTSKIGSIWRALTALALVYVTACAIGQIAGMELPTWAELYRKFVHPYEVATEPPRQLFDRWLGHFGLAFPPFWKNAFILWIATGRLVRRALDDIVQRTEAKHFKYNSETGKPPGFLDKIFLWVKDPSEQTRLWFSNPILREKIKWTLFPVGRLWVDLRGDYVTHGVYNPDSDETQSIEKFDQFIYWSLSPKTVLLYYMTAFLVLGAIFAFDLVQP